MNKAVNNAYKKYEGSNYNAQKNIEALNAWFNPPNVNKVAETQANALKDIFSKIINGEEVNSHEWTTFKTFQIITKVKGLESWSKLNNEIVYLVQWLSDYPKFKIDNTLKTQLRGILNRVQVGTIEELKQQNPSLYNDEDGE